MNSFATVHIQRCKFGTKGKRNTDWPRKLSSRERAVQSCSECVEAFAAHTDDNPRELKFQIQEFPIQTLKTQQTPSTFEVNLDVTTQ